MVLVTGGTGLLGSHLILQLLKNKEKVRAIHRKGSDLSLLETVASYYQIDFKNLQHLLEWVEADILDPIALDEAFKGVDYVYHCAAIVSFDPRDADKMLSENPRGTTHVVNTALEHKVKKLVYASSVAALGRKSENEYIHEECDWIESKHNSNYAKSKYRAELEVWRATQEGLKAAIVNPSIILGPGNWKKGSSALFRTIANGFKYHTLGTNAFVDVRDVVDIMVRLMQSDINEERFIVAGENLSYKKFFAFIAKGFGIRPPSKQVSPLLSAITWRLERVRTFLFGTKPLITRETAHTSQRTYYYDNSKVRERLNFTFRTIEDSTKEICGYYESDHS
jgi:nucleoside-diphosphate-sugar epimerase